MSDFLNKGHLCKINHFAPNWAIKLQIMAFFVGIWIDTSPETPGFTKINHNFQIIFEIPTKKIFRLSKNAPKMRRNYKIYSFNWVLVY
jgi:hypothetical protein